MSRIERLVAVFNADSTVKAAAVTEIETVNGRDFYLDPRPLNVADAAAVAALMGETQVAVMAANAALQATLSEREATIAAHEATIQTLTSERDALQAQIAAAQAVAVSAVPMSSARIALSRSGKLQAVQAAIQSIEGQPGEEARQWWEYSSEIRRNHPLVAALTPLIGTTEDVDALFALARQIADGNA